MSHSGRAPPQLVGTRVLKQPATAIAFGSMGLKIALKSLCASSSSSNRSEFPFDPSVFPVSLCLFPFLHAPNLLRLLSPVARATRAGFRPEPLPVDLQLHPSTAEQGLGRELPDPQWRRWLGFAMLPCSFQTCWCLGNLVKCCSRAGSCHGLGFSVSSEQQAASGC